MTFLYVAVIERNILDTVLSENVSFESVKDFL